MRPEAFFCWSALETRQGGNVLLCTRRTVHFSGTKTEKKGRGRERETGVLEVT